ncbi:MAG: hypothetical protein QG580_44 [Patescibacteria group bacterium]|jgi:prepilin-type N-terminal cleavage/methylation domain-containing protein|nr:hypothetical protein [Patescibacteria group bacterium]
MKIKNTKNNKGFTLIEVMISVGLFTVIMIIGITAILGVNNTYRKSRSMRAAIDNLSFIMEDMSRNIRLGYSYRCLDSIEVVPTEIEEPRDGFGCKGIAFEPFWDPVSGDSGDQVIYYIFEDPNTGIGSIFKSDAGGVDGSFSPMNSLNVDIDPIKSSFFIVGAESDSDFTQPFVAINLSGVASSSSQSTDFSLQTFVTQRLLDAPLNP